MILDYLYYKLYQAALKSSFKDIPNVAASAWLGALISANLLVIYIFLVKENVLPYLFTDPKQGGWLFGVIILLSLLYYQKNKRATVIEKFLNEDDYKRKRNNTVIAVYIALSFLLLFVVAFFKPGKL